MRFEVRVLAPEGIVSMLLDAEDARAAAEQAKARGLAILSVAQRREGMRGTERFSLILFTQELLALLSAGLGLIESITALADRQANAAARTVLEGVLQHLRDGKPLSAALGQHPQLFPALYVETVRASEQTGALTEALARFVAYQRQVEDVRQTLVSALIYPALLLSVGLLVSLFLVGYVVPRFSGVYEDLGRDLPWASGLLFAIGAVIDRNPALSVGLLFTLVATIALAARSESFRRRLGGWSMRAPYIGERLRVYRLARFYRTVSMLLHGGVPLVSALRMVAGLLDPASRAQLESAIQQVRQGEALSVALERNGLTTGIALRMLQVGERSGDLGGLMERAAEFHEDELARWVARFTRLFEPLLMMVIGLLIGGIVVLMYMPIFDLAGSLQ